jgi:hypothetical protein
MNRNSAAGSGSRKAWRSALTARRSDKEHATLASQPTFFLEWGSSERNSMEEATTNLNGVVLKR